MGRFRWGDRSVVRPECHVAHEQKKRPARHVPVWILGLAWLLLQSAGCTHTGSVEQSGASNTGSDLVEEKASSQEAGPPAMTGSVPADKGNQRKVKKAPTETENKTPKKPATIPDFTQPPPPAKPPAIGGSEG